MLSSSYDELIFEVKTRKNNINLVNLRILVMTIIPLLRKFDLITQIPKTDQVHSTVSSLTVFNNFATNLLLFGVPTIQVHSTVSSQIVSNLVID